MAKKFERQSAVNGGIEMSMGSASLGVYICSIDTEEQYEAADRDEDE